MLLTELLIDYLMLTRGSDSEELFVTAIWRSLRPRDRRSCQGHSFFVRPRVDPNNGELLAELLKLVRLVWPRQVVVWCHEYQEFNQLKSHDQGCFPCWQYFGKAHAFNSHTQISVAPSKRGQSKGLAQQDTLVLLRWSVWCISIFGNGCVDPWNNLSN